MFGSLDDHARAAAAADELARFAYDPAADAYTAAWIVARCVALAREDSRLTEAERGNSPGPTPTGPWPTCERRCGTASRTVPG